MSRKKKILGLFSVFGALTLSLTILSGLIFSSGTNVLGLNNGQDTQLPSISFDKNTNKIRTKPYDGTFTTGTGKAKTAYKNSIGFEYCGFNNDPDYWQSLQGKGWFKNTEQLPGIRSFSFEVDPEIKDYQISVYYGYDLDTYLGNASNTYGQGGFTTNFNGYEPDYIKVINNGPNEVKIKSIKIEFSCQKEYVDYYFENPTPELGTVIDYKTKKVLSRESFRYGENPYVVAEPKEHAKFLGFFADDVLVSELGILVSPLDDTQRHYVAKFARTEYYVDVSTSDASKGNVCKSFYAAPNDQVAINAKARFDKYKFDGWYEGDTKVSDQEIYRFKMPERDVSFVARFSDVTFPVVCYPDDPNKGSVVGAGNYFFNDSVTLTASEKDIGEFKGFYTPDRKTLLSNKMTYTFNMPKEKVEIVAVFSDSVTIKISTNRPDVVTLSGGGKFSPGEMYYIKATYDYDKYNFLGWLDKNGEIVYKSNDTNSVANTCLDLVATVEEKPKTIKFGRYPKTHVSDPNLIKELNTAVETSNNPWLTQREYYVFNDHSPYEPIFKIKDFNYKLERYRCGYVFKDTEKIARSNYPLETNIFFKFEPIEWQKVNDNNLYVTLNILEANQAFLDEVIYGQKNPRFPDEANIYANNWEYSDVRKYLNGRFYDVAFDDIDKGRIIETEIDNSLAQCSPNCDPKLKVNNTIDNVFLLSHAEANNSAYHFNMPNNRFGSINDYYYWWGSEIRDVAASMVRTPITDNGSQIELMETQIAASCNDCWIKYNGLQPAVYLKPH